MPAREKLMASNAEQGTLSQKDSDNTNATCLFKQGNLDRYVAIHMLPSGDTATNISLLGLRQKNDASICLLNPFVRSLPFGVYSHHNILGDQKVCRCFLWSATSRLKL